MAAKTCVLPNRVLAQIGAWVTLGESKRTLRRNTQESSSPEKGIAQDLNG